MDTDCTYIYKVLRGRRFGELVAWKLALVCLIAFAGVSAFGQAPSSLARGMLTQTYPEEYVFLVQPEDLWRTVSDEVKSMGHIRILVSDPEDRVLSWVELSDQKALPEAEKSHNATINSSGGRPSTPPVNPAPKSHLSLSDLGSLQQTEMTEVGADKVAVTTVIVITTPKGSVIRFRRIYYGSHTQPQIAYSTGAYETWLARRLAERLGVKVIPNK